MNDLEFALHHLRKSPGFTFVSLLTLPLGIDANAAILSVVSTVRQHYSPLTLQPGVR